MGKEKMIEDAVKLSGDLSFEHEIGDDPQELWRLVAWRHIGKRRMRCTSWWINEVDAFKEAGRLTDRGDDVVSVKRYVPQTKGSD